MNGIDNGSLTQVKSILSSLKERYFERDEVILCSLITMIAAEHMLLIGPPGAGKSAVLDDICRYIRDINVFKYMMNPKTSAEEILGPYHASDKEVGILRRITVNKLPEAQFAFLDETLRATGETLNSLLEILNDRAIIQNGQKQEVPLVSVFGATNDYPNTSDMHALYDRFLIRMQTAYIQDIANLSMMLKGGRSTAENDMGSLSLQDIKHLKKTSHMIELPHEIIDYVVSIRRDLFEKKIYPSDRRVKKSLSLLKVAALLDDRTIVERQDLWILKHIFWLKESEQKEVEIIIEDIIFQ